MKTFNKSIIAGIVAMSLSMSYAGITEDLANEELTMEQIVQNAVGTGMTIGVALVEIINASPESAADAVASALEMFPDDYDQIVKTAMKATPDNIAAITGAAIAANPDKAIEIVLMALDLSCHGDILSFFASECTAFIPIVTAAVEAAPSQYAEIVAAVTKILPEYAEQIIIAANIGADAAKLTEMLASGVDPAEFEPTAAGNTISSLRGNRLARTAKFIPESTMRHGGEDLTSPN
jgi:hypothetical protein